MQFSLNHDNFEHVPYIISQNCFPVIQKKHVEVKASVDVNTSSH